VHRFIPTTRMGIFTGILIILWGLRMFFLTSGVRLSHLWLGIIFDIATLLLAVPAVYYSLKLSRTLRKRLLWKISRRLILAHIFIGAIPVILVMIISGYSAMLFYYQLSYYLISNQIGIQTAQVHSLNISLREGLQELLMGASSTSPAALKERLDNESRFIMDAFPSASIALSFTDPSTNKTMTYFKHNLNVSGAQSYKIPMWLSEREFSCLSIDNQQKSDSGTVLFLKSFVYSDIRPDLPFSIEVSVPFDYYLLIKLKAALGQNLLLAKNLEHSENSMMPFRTEWLQKNIVGSTYNPTNGLVWKIPLFPISWNTGEEVSSNSSSLWVELSISRLIENIFRSENMTRTRTVLVFLIIIAAFFLVVEIISVVIGIVITRSITDAVRKLDRGTEFVKRGDFSNKIVVKSDDQLGALAASFNQMTEFVQQLIKERVKKERLERELEIAQEVQKRLFPDHAPQMQRMNLAGVCLPARTVSGDYYDFLPLSVHKLGLAIGDICGKGISAALLMTNLQATLRSNVINLHEQIGHNGENSISLLIERLNNQFYSYTADNKFATFFYAVYDELRQSLTYCNAGHNPPLFFKQNTVQRLSAGGTVVGVFADTKYEQETIAVNSGDLLIAYTDGIIESVNEYGEEFGEKRLIEVIQEHRGLTAEKMMQTIVDRVRSWSFSEERDDDMTLVVANFK
jgi:phosphoserine phosphatase RsbU/P